MRSRGVTFLQEIDDAVREQDWFVLVTGPGLGESAYVDHELAITEDRCIPIVTVLRVGGREHVPGRVRAHHHFDLRTDESGRDWRGLVQTLASAPPTAGEVSGRMPSRPAHLLPRSTDVAAVIDGLLDDVVRPLAISTSVSATAVAGMAGIGKTVLATLAARSCRVAAPLPAGRRLRARRAEPLG